MRPFTRFFILSFTLLLPILIYLFLILFHKFCVMDRQFLDEPLIRFFLLSSLFFSKFLTSQFIEFPRIAICILNEWGCNARRMNLAVALIVQIYRLWWKVTDVMLDKRNDHSCLNIKIRFVTTHRTSAPTPNTLTLYFPEQFL